MQKKLNYEINNINFYDLKPNKSIEMTYQRPSFIALILSGLTIGIALILFMISSDKLNMSQVSQMVLLFSIAVSLHGLLHFMYEHHYRFNPLTKMA